MTIPIIRISILLNCDKCFTIKNTNTSNIKVTFPEIAVINCNIHRSILETTQTKKREVD